MPSQAYVKELAIDFPTPVRYLGSDGLGGILAVSHQEIVRIDSNEIMSTITLPAANGQFPANPSLVKGLHQGNLYFLHRNEWIRYSIAHGWDSIPATSPLPTFAQPIQDTSPANSHSVPVLAQAIIQSGSNKTHDTLQLRFRPHAEWRKSEFTLSHSQNAAIDTLPFPNQWLGPTQPFSIEYFQTHPAYLVSTENDIWIGLGEWLVRRKGDNWSLFYSKRRVTTPPKNQGLSTLTALNAELKPSPGAPLTWRKNPVSGLLPYAYTGYLLASAIHSGPGWATEAAWGLGGFTLGGLTGFATGMLLGEGIMKSLPDSEIIFGANLIAVLVIVPMIGTLWAIESHQVESRQNKKWLRYSSGSFGMLTGAGIYVLFPIQASEWPTLHMYAGGLLGAVVGYRLAWY